MVELFTVVVRGEDGRTIAESRAPVPPEHLVAEGYEVSKAARRIAFDAEDDKGDRG